jgi:hypothetical protein
MARVSQLTTDPLFTILLTLYCVIYLAVLNIVVVMGEHYCFAVYFPFTVIFEGDSVVVMFIYKFFVADVLVFFF